MRRDEDRKPDACFHRHDILEVTDEFYKQYIYLYIARKQEPGKLTYTGICLLPL